jgi:hypothetical protein
VADRERVLALLHELEDADAEAGALLEELDGLARRTDAVRVRALELEAFEARLPSRREGTASEVARAGAEEVAALDALSVAEDAVRTSTKEREAEARRFEVRARDRLSVAKRRRTEAEAAVDELESEAQAAHEEARGLASRAAAIAEQLRGRPRVAEDAGADPGSELDGIAGWGETARAALFVARGQVAAERDAVIRQANELGAVVLGEPLTSASAVVVARRVERALS